MPASTDGAFSVTGGGATVTDDRTGLEWKRCSEGYDWNGTMSTCDDNRGVPNTYTRAEALAAARIPPSTGAAGACPTRRS